MLVVITIAAVAGGLLMSLMVSSGNLFVDQSAQINHGLSLNQSRFEITRLIKTSAGIADQYPVQGTPQYTTDSNTLVLKLPAIGIDGEIIDLVYDYAVIEADSQKPAILRKQVFKDDLSFRKTENKVLSTTLDSLDFTYLDINNAVVVPSEAIRVAFTISLSTKSGSSNRDSTGSGTVNIKNL